MKRITLVARIKLIEDGKLKFKFERVETQRRGKPVRPVEPANATTYYLRLTLNGKQVMQPVGANFQQALLEQRNKEMEVEYAKRGLDVPNLGSDSRRSIADAVEQFVKNQSTLDKASSTVYSYTRSVEAFRDTCRKRYMDEITRQDLLDHVQWMRENVPTRGIGQQNGTIRARLRYLTVFFTENSMKPPLPMKEWPKVEERRVEAYTSEQIGQLLSKATPDEKDLIEFFLFTGFRDDEAAHSVYADVNFKTHEIKVGPKPEIGFTTKNGKERVVRVPAELIERLRERQQRVPGVLIFPNASAGVDSALLRRVRAAAQRAKFVGRVTLHKFRKTFGTRYGEKHGIVNAQHLLGHADIKTTQRYMAETKIARSSVEALFEDVVGK